MKKNNRKTLLVVALLLVVGISTCFVAGTYAKYTAQVSGTGTATVAKWAFDSDNAISTLDIEFDKTYNPSTLVNQKIAPGTKGAFGVKLVNTNSEVGVDFEVKLGALTNAPTNIKFYKDETYTQEITTGDTITGQLAAKDSTGIEVKVYWEWKYETGAVSNGIAAGDGADTTDGKSAKTLSVPVTIRGVQTPPSVTAITTHID